MKTHPIPETARGETCAHRDYSKGSVRCGKPAAHKLGDEMLEQEPWPRHNATAYLCCAHWCAALGFTEACQSQEPEAPAEPECPHESVPQPTFDLDIARREDLTAQEVRKRYPRVFQQCLACKQTVIRYASMDHYLWGDW